MLCLKRIDFACFCKEFIIAVIEVSRRKVIGFTALLDGALQDIAIPRRKSTTANSTTHILHVVDLLCTGAFVVQVYNKSNSPNRVWAICRPTRDRRRSLVYNSERSPLSNWLTTRCDDRLTPRGEILLSPEFGTMFQREIPLFWSYPNLLKPLYQKWAQSV